MSTVTSKDGTKIAYTKQGNGPAVILVDGALCYRKFGPNGALATALASDFTVYTYDRRGRGESGDTLPFAAQREIEDIEAMIDAAGGSAILYGISSGGALALDAAEKLGSKVSKVAVYEIPFFVDNGHAPIPSDYVEHINALVAADQRSQAVKYFMSEVIGFPKAMVALFPLFPGWSSNKAIAHTLVYDAAFVMDSQQCKPLPKTKWQGVSQPTLVVTGGKSPAWVYSAAAAIQKQLKNSVAETLEGQAHQVKAAALAPVVTAFFKQ